MPMTMISQTATAGTPLKMFIGGDLFRLVSCVSPVDIKFYKQGREVGNAVAMDTGFYTLPAGGFEMFEISSASTQTIKLLVMDGEGGYERFNVDITGSPILSIKQADTINNVAAVSVGTSATLLLAASSARRGCRFRNEDSVDVWIGGAGVTTANGAIKVPSGGTWIESEAATAEIYGVSGTAGQSVRIQELV